MGSLSHLALSNFLLLGFLASPAVAQADGGPLSAYLLTNEEIAQNCAASIRSKSKITDGKTQCELIYEGLRSEAQQYLDAQTALAGQLASQGNCGSAGTQEGCLNSGNKLSQTALAAQRQLASIATGAQAAGVRLSGSSP